MNYYLGVDIGTTSSKAVAFSANGEILSQYSFGYEMLHPQTGWCEQSPDDILRAVVEGINKVQNELAPAQPVLISFSAAMHSLLLVDRNGDPLTNSIIWADSRAVDIAADLRNTPRGSAFYRLSGVPVQAMSPLCKLLWFKENDHSVFEKAYKFIGVKEYLFSRIFGEYAVDTAIAAATGLLNLETLQWDESILSFSGIEKSKLSEVVNIKKIFYYQKEKQHASVGKLSLPEKTAVVIGGSDGALANIGTGAVDKHSMVITIGTSSAARIITDKPATDPAMRTFCYHAKDDSYIIGGASNNGAVVLQWLTETLLQTHESIPQLFKLAKNIPAGSDGLLFLPYILGERAPIWDSYAKGNFFGLTINHTKAHMVRSVMEGVIYAVYSIGKILMEKNPSIEIFATGGFANSPLWLEILADVCNCRVLVSGSVESSAMGAVVVGLESLHLPPMPANKILSVHEPDRGRHEIYQAQFKKFERIYELLKEEFKNDSMPLEKGTPASVAAL